MLKVNLSSGLLPMAANLSKSHFKTRVMKRINQVRKILRRLRSYARATPFFR